MEIDFFLKLRKCLHDYFIKEYKEITVMQQPVLRILNGVYSRTYSTEEHLDENSLNVIRDSNYDKFEFIIFDYKETEHLTESKIKILMSDKEKEFWNNVNSLLSSYNYEKVRDKNWYSLVKVTNSKKILDKI